MNIDRRILQKGYIRLRELAHSGKIRMYEQWMNDYDSYYHWFQSQVLNLNDARYVCDPYLKNWLSTDPLVYYGPETCSVIPIELFNSIKIIPLCKQHGNIYSPGLSIDKSTGRFKVNFNNKSVGMRDTELEAFNYYKTLKENELRTMTQSMLASNVITQETYNILMNLQVYSLRFGINAQYNPEPILASIKQQAQKPRSPIIIDDRAKLNIGTMYKCKTGEWMQILDYQGKFKVTIKFLDWFGYVTVANMDNIRKGSVKNPYHILANGGYFGAGPYVASRCMNVYKVWDSMLRRALMHKNNGSHQLYNNCSVCEEWRNFQIFADWYIKYVSSLNPNYSYQIDKDIFQWGLVNKIYSPQTCCLIPDQLNDLLNVAEHGTGNGAVIGEQTKTKIKNLALSMLNDGAILKPVYDKIMSLGI